MTKKIALVLATGIVVGLVAGMVIGGGVGSAQGGKPPQTLVYTDKTITSHNIDVGRKGFSAGDSFAGHDNLLQNGKVVGKLTVECTIADLNRKTHSATALCNAVAKLAGGQLDLTARPTFANNNPSFRIGITGGTNAYRNASGYGVGTSVNSNTNKVTLYLST
jgi:hypothetical protein